LYYERLPMSSGYSPHRDCVHTVYRGWCARCGLQQPKLSGMAIRILKLLSTGLSQSQVAYEVDKHVGTIKYHVHHVAELLNIDDPTIIFVLIQAHRMRIINFDKEESWT